MARIELPPGDLEEPYRLFSLAPNVSAGAAAYSEAIYTKSSLPLRLRELLRMRIAELNQCRVCLSARVPSLEAAGLTEELLANTGNYATYPGFTEAERDALDYTTRFATDHMSIDQELVDRLRAHFGDETVFEITLCIAGWLALGRVNAVMDVSVACPLVV
ncbi:MAG TPA: carboxymuconolactone decarboxylase family protein [Acidimicrobiales bacterium]